jgi:hypothetical protein
MIPTRRAFLLLPALLAACGEDEPGSYPPPTYDYLPPIPLEVGSIDVEQFFFPSGVADDATPSAPTKPVAALRAMADDRLKPFGARDKAVLEIRDATLTKRGDTLSVSLSVTVTILREGGEKAGFARAQVARRETGGSGSVRFRLHKLVAAAMDQMNIELEYQIRRNLKDWIAEEKGRGAPGAVYRAPLEAPERR